MQQGAPQMFPPAVNMMFNRPPGMQPGGMLPNTRPNFGNHLPAMNLPGLQVCNLYVTIIFHVSQFYSKKVRFWPLMW
jgi:hypothetical protein